MVNILPPVKEYIRNNKKICVNAVKWIFGESVDNRVKSAAKRVINPSEDGIRIYVSHGFIKSEEYTIKIEQEKIEVSSPGAAGAYYAIITLSQMFDNLPVEIYCGEINDKPDMSYRGFYHDITRGRVPTLDTLKKLVDTMSKYKLNSLQLYVEHSFEFKEYIDIRDKLGYITADEMRELDKYCSEHFIELVPSLSTFGHLYHLLQSEKYKHLCELYNYQPVKHYWIERMYHHTINPILDESFEVITSLIDQYVDVFSSNYFNICCDETFDLGTDVNKDKDKGTLYIDFVKKIAKYLSNKGKRVMMWGDIMQHYRNRMDEMPDNIIFLNWDYAKEPAEERVAAIKERTQIVCPGTSSWMGFSEITSIEESNIIKLADYGYKYGAKGILNTNWGDLGNIASLDMAMYGLVLGAVKGWEKNVRVTDELRRDISLRQYKNIEAVNILREFSKISLQTNWSELLGLYTTDTVFTQKLFSEAEEICNNVIDYLKNTEFIDERIKNEFMLAAQGYSLIVKWHAKKHGFAGNSNVDFEQWLEAYKNTWLSNSKTSEIEEVIKVFSMIEQNKFRWN